MNFILLILKFPNRRFLAAAGATIDGSPEAAVKRFCRKIQLFALETHTPSIRVEYKTPNIALES